MSSAATSSSRNKSARPTPGVELQVVYFDMGNVLVHFDHEIAVEQMATLVDRTCDEVRQVVFDSELQTDYETGRVDDVGFHSLFCEQLNVSCELSELKRAASDIFRINTRVFQIVAQLHAFGIKLGILSNTCHAHWEFIRNRYRLVSDFFDLVVLSYEVGAMKPDAEIYRSAIELAKVPAEHIFFMDDKPENVAGAKNFGIDSEQFLDSTLLARQLHHRLPKF